MHSSRMRTARSSSRQEGGLPQCMLGYTPWVWAWRPPPGVGLGTPQVWDWSPLQVWAWRPPRCGPGDPPGVGLETPQARPFNFPLGCGPGDPPWPDPSTSPLGVGLETCKACWDTTTPPWRPAARHIGIPILGFQS